MSRKLDLVTQNRQRATMDKLKSENAKLKDDLLLENKFGVAHSTAATAQIAKLQDQADMFTRKIEMEKRRVAELDKQTALMNQKIMEQRKKMGGINAARENNQQIQKQIKVLENRLEKALVKYNEAIAHNKKLRGRIDNLRRERLVYDQIHKKLEKELESKKEEMKGIVEISEAAYESRENALAEMTQLKQQADQEQSLFESEWKDLGKLQDHDRRMKDFTKGVNREAEEKRIEMAAEEEQKIRKRVIKGNWSLAKDKAAHKATLNKVQSYAEAFNKIQQATGISDIDELVTTFLNAEDQNFSLFNYVSELNQETEKLEEQIAEIKSEIEKYKGQGVNTENQRKKILVVLEERLSKTELKAESYEKKFETAQKTVNSLKQGIWSIFNKVGCNTPAVREMLGEGGVSDGNMMQYLGIIEQRTNEILQLYAVSQSSQHGEGGNTLASLLGQGPQAPTGSVQVLIEPPSTTDADFEEDSEDEADDDARPLNRNEITQKVSKRILKRDAGGKAGKPSKPAKSRTDKPAGGYAPRA